MLKGEGMGKKSLAEAVILQSMEDLWDEKERDNALRFFNGEGFSTFAGIAGMNFFEQLRLYNMVNKMTKGERHERKKVKNSFAPAAV